MLFLGHFVIEIFPRSPYFKKTLCEISVTIAFGLENSTFLAQSDIFIPKGAHPCTSSSEQGGGKRVLEAFF